MQQVSLETIYNEIKTLKHEVELIRSALIPEEKVSDKELKEILEIDATMQSGERTRFKDALAELNV